MVIVMVSIFILAALAGGFCRCHEGGNQARDELEQLKTENGVGGPVPGHRDGALCSRRANPQRALRFLESKMGPAARGGTKRCIDGSFPDRCPRLGDAKFSVKITDTEAEV